jgi:alpha-beta hydrolase superfamily lysophospholipase
MRGNLICYDGEKRLCAFESAMSNINDEMSHDITVVVIGGMGDGLLALPWVNDMINKFTEPDFITNKLTVVQPLLSSSYGQWGMHSLLEDSTELTTLLNYLQTERPRKFILIGHSTGCQNILHLMRQDSTPQRISAVILQSPIPDRMYLASTYSDEWCEMAAWAQEHKDDDIYPSTVCGAPITAYRLRSLLTPGGDDDYFSLDMSAQDRQERFRGVTSHGTPLFVQWSGKEEYMGIQGTELQAWYNAMGEAVQQACDTASIWPVLLSADHAISDSASQEVFIERVMSVLKRVVTSEKLCGLNGV